MPRAKYAQPSGTLPPSEKVQRSKFQFRPGQWSKLTQMLPSKLAIELDVPRDEVVTYFAHYLPDMPPTLPDKIRTFADCVVFLTERLISSHLTGAPLAAEAAMNPANVRAAIQRLRRALKPFTHGSVDSETAEIVPADLELKLAKREEEVSKLRLPSKQRRMLGMLCQTIEKFVREFAIANAETVGQRDVLLFIHAALSFASIKHPDPTKHRTRLVALIFPKG